MSKQPSEAQELMETWAAQATQADGMVKLRLKVDMQGGQIMGQKGDIFAFRPVYAAYQLREHPDAWEEVRDEEVPPPKNLPRRKPGNQPLTPHVPGAPPDDRNVRSTDVVQR